MCIELLTPEIRNDNPNIIIRIANYEGICNARQMSNVIEIDIKFIVISWKYIKSVFSLYQGDKKIDIKEAVITAKQVSNDIKKSNYCRIEYENTIKEIKRIFYNTCSACTSEEYAYKQEALNILMYSLCLNILHEIGHMIHEKFDYALALGIANKEHAEEINADYYAVCNIVKLPLGVMKEQELQTDERLEEVYRYVALLNTYNYICFVSFAAGGSTKRHPNPVDRIRYMDKAFIECLDKKAKALVDTNEVKNMCNDFRGAHAIIACTLFIDKQENETSVEFYEKVLTCLHSLFDKRD